MKSQTSEEVVESAQNNKAESTIKEDSNDNSDEILHDLQTRISHFMKEAKITRNNMDMSNIESIGGDPELLVERGIFREISPEEQSEKINSNSAEDSDSEFHKVGETNTTFLVPINVSQSNEKPTVNYEGQLNSTENNNTVINNKNVTHNHAKNAFPKGKEENIFKTLATRSTST